MIAFVGQAMACAALATLAAAGVLRLSGTDRRRTREIAALVAATAFFVSLTQVPFPDPARLDCPVPTAAPQLAPFHFVSFFVAQHARDAGPAGWFGNRAVMATVMNFLVCGVVGLALGFQRGWRWRAAALYGAGLTLLVELTQLTGVWGIYPCAYRQFNVDDLILNLAGVLCGFALARAFARGRARDTAP